MATTKKKPAAAKKPAPAPKKSASRAAAAVRAPSEPKPAKIDFASVLATAPHASDAAGLDRAKGMGVNPGVDAFLGLGFPYLIVPTDDDALTFETCGAFARMYPDDANVMPRAAVLQQYVMRVPPNPAMLLLTAADPVPPLRKIALPEAIKRALQYHDGRKIQQLEVLFGSRAVAEEIVSQLAKLPIAKWASDRGIAPVISAGLRWLLWRVPHADRERMRATLENTWRRMRSAPHGRGGRALDVMLHGRAGVERSGNNFNGELHLYDLVSAEDDPQWALDKALAIVRTMRPQDRAHFNIQLVVLCGKKLLTAFRASVDKLLVAERKRTSELLALFR